MTLQAFMVLFVRFNLQHVLSGALSFLLPSSPGNSESAGTASFARCGSDSPQAFLPEAGRAFVCASGLRERSVCFGCMGWSLYSFWPVPADRPLPPDGQRELGSPVCSEYPRLHPCVLLSHCAHCLLRQRHRYDRFRYPWRRVGSLWFYVSTSM